MSQQPYQPDPRQQSYPYQGNYGAQDYNEETQKNIQSGNAYVKSQHQAYADPQGNRVEKSRQVYNDPVQRTANARYLATSLTYFILAVLEVILGLRFIFRFLGANQGSAFIDFLYNFSSPFVILFNGIFNDQTIGRGGVFEWSTLLAMLIYALIGWGIVSLFRIVLFPRNRGYSESSTVRSRKVS